MSITQTLGCAYESVATEAPFDTHEGSLALGLMVGVPLGAWVVLILGGIHGAGLVADLVHAARDLPAFAAAR